MPDEFLTAADGTRLFVRRWDVANPRGLAVLVHGIGEHSGRYEWLAQQLVQRQIAVRAMDHRGHGRSGGPRGDCVGLDSLVQDLDRLISSPCVVIGHSLGGLVALTYAAQHPEKVQAVAVSSPALKLAHPPSALKTFLVETAARLSPQWPFPNGVDPRLLCHDPAVVKAYVTDPLVHRVIRARCAVALRDAMRESPALADRIRVPCLILQAGADEVCDSKTAEAFAQRADGARVTLRAYPGLYHELFNEPQKGRVVEDLIRWLDEVLRGATP